MQINEEMERKMQDLNEKMSDLSFDPKTYPGANEIMDYAFAKMKAEIIAKQPKLKPGVVSEDPAQVSAADLNYDTINHFIGNRKNCALGICYLHVLRLEPTVMFLSPKDKWPCPSVKAIDVSNGRAPDEAWALYDLDTDEVFAQSAHSGIEWKWDECRKRLSDKK